MSAEESVQEPHMGAPNPENFTPVDRSAQGEAPYYPGITPKPHYNKYRRPYPRTLRLVQDAAVGDAIASPQQLADPEKEV